MVRSEKQIHFIKHIIFTWCKKDYNDNARFRSCNNIIDHQITHAITSSIEHHAVLHTLEAKEKSKIIKLSLVDVDKKGNINFDHLEELLRTNERSFVSLMHANNEIGTLTDIKRVGELCEKYNAIYHCDTVQTMGHYRFDVQDLKVHFLVCAAHKLHGPKGTGFLYINHNIKVNPFIYGGAQERNMRGGTENIYGIVGLAKALELSIADLEENHAHIQGLKSYMMEELAAAIPGVEFNGETDPGKSLYTILNVSFPESEIADILLFNLDIAGISVSGGSACSSGTNIGSHVLTGIGADPQRPAVRFSFSKLNTKDEVDYAVKTLKDLYLSHT